MKAAQTLNNLRFVSCAGGLGLVIILLAAARRATTGEGSVSPAAWKPGNGLSPVPMNKFNLTCREICRGKISLRKKSTNLEERTL